MNDKTVNRGFLYPVKERKSDKSPTLTGKLFVSPELAGREIEIAGWTQTSKNGVKYISVAVSEPWKPEQATDDRYSGNSQSSPGQAQDNFNRPASTADTSGFDDNIPF